MLEQGMQVPIDALICRLQGCIRRNDLVVGKQVYSLFVENGLQWNVKLGCLFIRMFASCGCLLEASQVFSSLHSQNVYSWTAIISAHVHHNQGEQAVILYNQMQASAVKPSTYTFVAVLKACASVVALDQGKLIHAEILKQGLQSDLFVGSALVGMYANCVCLQDARNVFDGLLGRDTVTWSVMIGGYVEHGRIKEALKLFKKIQQEGSDPNKATFLCLLKGCANTSSLLHGKDIHADIIKRGLDLDVYVGSSLVDMYAKCGSLGDARKLFDKLPQSCDVVAWNAMIAGYAEHGCYKESFELFEDMKQQKRDPNTVTFLSILKVCSSIRALDQGKLIHGNIMIQGVESDLLVGSSLVDIYAKCGSLEDAWSVFDKLSVRDAVAWAAMIAAYALHEHSEDALQIYVNMQLNGTEPDAVIFVGLLKACAKIPALAEGKLIHAHIIRQKVESNLFVGNTLVDMYAKCGSLDAAQIVFDKLPVHNIVSWSAMIAAYNDHDYGEKALKLFTKVQEANIELDVVTFVSVLKACASISALGQGKLIHADVVKQGLELDILIGSTLVHMYAKCGSLEDASKAFDKLHARDVVAWSTMILGYTELGHGERALELFEKMQQEGLNPDKVTLMCILKACFKIADQDRGKSIHAEINKWGLEVDLLLGSALIDMYCKFGNLEDAQKVFDSMLAQDVVSWCAMISGYVEHGCAEEALELLGRMQQEGTEPNEIIYLCILKACSSTATLHMGKLIHTNIKKRCFESALLVGSTLVDMYAKCGNLEDAVKVFEELPEQNLVSWSALIAGYAAHGLYEVAKQLFDGMQHEGIKPDGVAFVCLLSACSHAGMVQEGHCYFNAMSMDYGFTSTIEHYICIVDMLGRAGCLDAAEQVCSKMPFQPTSVVWVTLLSSCAKHGNMEIGSRAFDFLLESDCSNPAAYVLMSNIYAANLM